MKFSKRSASVVVLGTLGFACSATPPPKELVEARNTYNMVAAGVTAKEKPADLLTAKQQLDRATTLFNDKGDTDETKTSAYVAQRKALLAESIAHISIAEKDKIDAEHGVVNLQSENLRRAQGELQNTRSALDQTKNQLDQTKDQLAREKIAREEAEKKAAQAMADLQKIAAVKKEDRGVVITLSGAVLFSTDKSELQPAAMAQLNQVADALIKSSPDSKITVEGHTDSQGRADYNRELSQKRAEAVGNYLASRGIAPDRITDVGIGADRPIASNSNSDGRAQNRRVEIIVK